MATFADCTGSIFDSECEALVNPVNCVGVMGKGLALEFKRRYPWAWRDYALACRLGLLTPAGLVQVSTDPAPTGVRRIVHFPTKGHWKDASRLDDLKASLAKLAASILAFSITSIAIPALGCGLGGLDWADVRPLIVAALGSIDGLAVELYGPGAR